MRTLYEVIMNTYNDHTGLTEFEKDVQDKLDDGWSLHGNLIVCSENEGDELVLTLFQAMTKEVEG